MVIPTWLEISMAHANFPPTLIGIFSVLVIKTKRTVLIWNYGQPSLKFEPIIVDLLLVSQWFKVQGFEPKLSK